MKILLPKYLFTSVHLRESFLIIFLSIFIITITSSADNNQEDANPIYSPSSRKSSHEQQRNDELFIDSSISYTPRDHNDHQDPLYIKDQTYQAKEYLVHNIAEDACKLNRGCQRKDRLNNTYLNFCARYKLENILSNDILMLIMHDSTEKCNSILDEFIQLDETIEYFDRLFKKLLARYNCYNGYSVKWTCDDCKRAYKDWLCAINLPYYMNGEQIKPCISFCERVEQRCPYLHPIARGQYGGQPVFICRDPNIPFVPEITPDIPYSDPYKCYDLCHLTENLTELIMDSLSKYDYDKCPDKKSIAAEVRSNPFYCNPENKSHKHDIFSDYSTTFDEEDNDVGTDGALGKRRLPEHLKKLKELQEVLAVYKSQPGSHPLSHHPTIEPH